MKRKTSERLFWKYYLSLYNVTNSNLTSREIKVLTIILSGDYFKSYFKGKARQELIKISGIKSNNLSPIKASLIEKGFLKKTNESRGDILLTKNLRGFQEKVKACLKKENYVKINLTFEFEEV